MAGKTRRVVLTIARHYRVETKTCLQCHKKFEAVKIAKYCSKRCANNASYARHAEQARARRRAKYQAGKKTKS